LQPDGTVDQSFATLLEGPNTVNGLVVNPTVWNLLRQSDGRLIVSGYFEAIDGQPRNSLARLEPDGTLDPSYLPAFAPLYTSSMALQPDDKLIIGDRTLTQVGNVPRKGIARLNVDGSLDTDFDPGAGITFGSQDPFLEKVFRAIVVQPDGRIVISGAFATVGNQPRTNLARLHSDGRLDEEWNPGQSITGEVTTLALDSEGRLIIAGRITRVAGQPRSGIARLDPAGRLDDTYNPVLAQLPDGYPIHVRAIVLQDDGQALIGGTFASVNGVPRNGIARLLPDGSLDGDFDPGAEMEFAPASGIDERLDTRFTFNIAPSGWLYIGGAFLHGNAAGLVRYGLAKPESAVAFSLPTLSQGIFSALLQGIPGRKYRIEYSTDLVTWTPWTVLSSQESTLAIHDTAPAGPHRFYRAINDSVP
jgi:uncharacterized delta-60 repeat protein